LKHTQLKQNRHQLEIVSFDDLVELWRENKNIGHSALPILDKAARSWTPLKDLKTATKIIYDLGLTGKIVTKTVGGKSYIIFKGLPGTRSIFTGTRYLASNPKVIHMAIGRAGVNASLASGAVITLVLVVPINVVRHILDDEATLSSLVGTTASDVVKIGASTFITSSLVTSAHLSTFAVAPLAIVLFAGVGIGFTLDSIDHQFGLTAKLIELLENGWEQTNQIFKKMERRLLWQQQNGIPLGRGMFY
jgi:hypothetical protein